jgi:hypothetical protein
VRFYSNENFPLQTVLELRALGHDVLTTFEAGNAGQRIPDDEVLRFAAGDRRAILTINRRDFIRLDRGGLPHAGIVACTQDPDTQGQAMRIHEAVKQYDVLDGQVIRVNRPAR